MAKPETQAKPAKIADLGEHKCRGEECKRKPERAGFCSEHYDWFKWGLMTLEGFKARDFDKKWQGFAAQRKAG